MATVENNKHNEQAHEHKHEHEFPKMSKYDEALSKYNTDLDDAAVDDNRHIFVDRGIQRALRSLHGDNVVFVYRNGNAGGNGNFFSTNS